MAFTSVTPSVRISAIHWQRFGQIDREWVGLGHPPPVREWKCIGVGRTGIAGIFVERNAIEDVQPCRDDDVRRHRGANRLDNVARQSRAVLVTAAEGPRPIPCAEQFAQQVPVALFHVDEVEPDRDRELGDRDIGIDEPFQFVVGNDRVIRRDFLTGFSIHNGAWVEDWIVSRKDRPLTVSARVSELQSEEKIGIVAVCVAMGLTAVGHDVREVRFCRLVQRNLPWRRAAFLNHGTRLAPNKLRATRAEPNVAAESEFSWPAVEFPVASFHRVNAPTVADRPPADCNGLEHRREIVAESYVDPEPRVLGFQIGNRLVLEERGHFAPEVVSRISVR